MTTKTKNPFNQSKAIQANLSSEEERADKIMEMNKRGFYAVRTYEYERGHKDFVATGYHHSKVRYNGEESRTIYGVLFRRVDNGMVSEK